MAFIIKLAAEISYTCNHNIHVATRGRVGDAVLKRINHSLESSLTPPEMTQDRLQLQLPGAVRSFWGSTKGQKSHSRECFSHF